jgi:dihydropteroate synthase
MTGLEIPKPVGAGVGRPAITVLRATRPLVCGILNVTPDSFSDAGRFLDLKRAIAHGLELASQGADVIDIGGESTRPSAQPPTLDEELNRVVPVVRSLARLTDVPLSVDTSRPEVMREAVRAGASMINDVRALRMPGALGAAAELAVPVCLMHMRGEPGTMQRSPRYHDVVSEVRRFLTDRIRAAERAGVKPERILLDPGFGFGKPLTHNMTLLAELRQFTELGARIMVGLSPKSMIGAITGRPVELRLAGSVAAAIIAVQRGRMSFVCTMLPRLVTHWPCSPRSTENPTRKGDGSWRSRCGDAKGK